MSCPGLRMFFLGSVKETLVKKQGTYYCHIRIIESNPSCVFFLLTLDCCSIMSTLKTPCVLHKGIKFIDLILMSTNKPSKQKKKNEHFK